VWSVESEVQVAVNKKPLLRRMRKARRRFVKRMGRRFILGVANFVGDQGLVKDLPVHDAGAFPFLAPIEANWTVIRAELETLLKDRANLPAFHQISPDQKKISKQDLWKVFILFGFAVPSQRNCARCPETTKLLRQIPKLQSAWFSILSPRYHIARHRGVTKTVLRAHLGLIIPQARENCRMQVGDDMVVWETGKCVVFDDFYPHEVWNDTDEERVVLIFDFERPMRLPGRIVAAILSWGIKRTAYFKDAERNLKNWDERLEAAVNTANEMMDAKLP
jgi:aspartyl/asparaginyl beta-hydroxylase (cupin superfamily)